MSCEEWNLNELDLNDAQVRAELREEFERLIDEADKAAISDPDYWLYSPRNPSDRITDRIYCGGDDYLYDAGEHAALLKQGITHVLDCRSEHGTLWGGVSKTTLKRRKQSFVYLVNPTNDDYKPKTVEYFRKSIEFGLKALTHPDGKLYVHCAAGINRGPSSCYAILRATGMNPVEAEGVLRANRPGVNIAYRDDAERAVKELGYE